MQSIAVNFVNIDNLDNIHVLKNKTGRFSVTKLTLFTLDSSVSSNQSPQRSIHEVSPCKLI
jgi:hypothetical protein